ncbi:hypothetical protein OROHE_011595 [Orobanche hederae]
MATFSLTSNNYFLRTFPHSQDIFVFDFKDDITSFDIVLSPHSYFTLRARIGDSQQHKALEVFGTTIHGDKLVKLASDLTLKSGVQTFYLMVNREGLCFLSVNGTIVKRLRLNDYFGWSKFGVKPEIETVWNKFNMFDRRIVIGLEEMKKSLSESKDRETELSETLLSKSKELDICKSQLMEYRTELFGLRKNLEKMKNEKEELEKKGIEEAESGEEWKKVAEERGGELRKVKSQLVGKTKHADTLKDVADSLMKSMWDLNKLGRREMVVLWKLAVLKVGAIPNSLRTWWINNQVK